MAPSSKEGKIISKELEVTLLAPTVTPATSNPPSVVSNAKLAIAGTAAVLGGVGMSASITLGATLSEFTGQGIRSALINFCVSFCILLTATAIRREWRMFDFETFRTHFTWWVLPMPGFFGSSTIASSVVLLAFISYGTLSTFFIAGQMIVSTIFDHFELLGTKKDPLTIWKFLGLTVLTAGAVCVQGFGGDTNDEPWKLAVFGLLSLVVGGLAPFQAVFNRNAVPKFCGGSPLLAANLSFLFGILFLSIWSSITMIVAPAGRPLAESRWFNWCGGVGGSFYVLTTAFCPKFLGTGLYFACVVAGQIGTAVALDAFKFLPGAKTKDLTPLRIGGICMVLTGALGLQVLKFLQNNDVTSISQLFGKESWTTSKRRTTPLPPFPIFDADEPDIELPVVSYQRPPAEV